MIWDKSRLTFDSLPLSKFDLSSRNFNEHAKLYQRHPSLHTTNIENDLGEIWVHRFFSNNDILVMIIGYPD